MIFFHKILIIIFWIIYQLSLEISFVLSSNDIYKYAPKGEKINFTLFRSLERIIKTENRYIIILNLHSTKYFWDMDMAPAYYIIVCDHNLVVQGACIQPRATITSANDSTIFAWTSKSIKNDWYYPYRGHAEEYRNDLPKNIKFKIDFKNERYVDEHTTTRILPNFDVQSVSINYIKDNLKLCLKPYKDENYEIIEIPISKTEFIYDRLYYLEYIGDSSYYNNFILSERKEKLFFLENSTLRRQILYNLWINANKAKKKTSK